MRTIGAGDALEALRAVVTDKGTDYIYRNPPGDPDLKRCVNAWEVDGVLKPLCIVGCALHHLGVPVELLAQRPSFGVYMLADYLGRHGYTITPGACAVFRAAQAVQDAVNIPHSPHHHDPTWGNALRHAEQEATQWIQGGAL